MRKKVQKGRCEKRQIPKCNEILKTFDAVQYACADYLSVQDDIVEIRCNVILDGLEEGAEFTSDFVCRKREGDLLVREYLQYELTKINEVTDEFGNSVMHKRFTMIADILPVITDEKLRSNAIVEASVNYEISKQTIKIWMVSGPGKSK